MLLAIGAALPTTVRADRHDNHLLTARAFAVRIVRLIGTNSYAQAWNRLYPLHQQVVSRDRYVECENLTPIPGRISSIRALRAWDTPVRIAGLQERVKGTKVTVRIVIADTSSAARTIVLETVGLVEVSGRWTWFLPPDRYAAYLAGGCPK